MADSGLFPPDSAAKPSTGRFDPIRIRQLRSSSGFTLLQDKAALRARFCSGVSRVRATPKEVFSDDMPPRSLTPLRALRLSASNFGQDVRSEVWGREGRGGRWVRLSILKAIFPQHHKWGWGPNPSLVRGNEIPWKYRASDFTGSMVFSLSVFHSDFTKYEIR